MAFRHDDPCPVDEQAEAVVESVGDLLDAEHPDPRGGELDRQRDAVEPPADLGDGPRGRRRHGERQTGGASALDEERSSRQRSPRASRLPGAAAAAGRRPPRRRRAGPPCSSTSTRTVGHREHVVHEVRDCVDEVLGVVDHEQRLALGQVVRHRARRCRPARHLREAPGRARGTPSTARRRGCARESARPATRRLAGGRPRRRRPPVRGASCPLRRARQASPGGGRRGVPRGAPAQRRDR